MSPAIKPELIIVKSLYCPAPLPILIPCLLLEIVPVFVMVAPEPCLIYIAADDGLFEEIVPVLFISKSLT